MARSVTAGQPALTFAGSYDATAAKQMQDVVCQGVFVVLSGTADPIPFPGNVVLNAGSADSCTLATPVAGQQPAGDDGKTLFVVDNSGKAHTITTASNIISPSHHIATFNGTVGSCIELRAWNGLWYPTGTPLGVALS